MYFKNLVLDNTFGRIPSEYRVYINVPKTTNKL